MNINKKRILCLIDSLASGGAQRQMVGLASLLQDKGYVVKIVTYYDIPFYRSFLVQNSIDHESLSCRKGLVSRLFAVNKAIKRFKPDVVISYLDTPCLLACIIKGFSKGWKLIVSERNTTQKESRRDKIKFFLYQNADFIVPNSYSQAEFIATHYNRLFSKCLVITNFVDTETFRPAYNTDNKGGLAIVGVGRISTQKNIPLLIEAIKLVHDTGLKVKVDWYGNRLESYDICLRLIRQYGLETVFQFHEPFNPIIEKYQAADLFVLPSVYEGFPNVLCEALSCGVPSIASDVCDNGKIITHGYNGFLFRSGDANEFANSIIRFAKLSNEKKMDMSNKSREVALKLFSKETFIKKYLDLIES